MNDPQAILETIHEGLVNGWTGVSEIVPDHVRVGYIEATYYATSEDLGTPVRIHVEVMQP